jgi:hypothetical protein
MTTEEPTSAPEPMIIDLRARPSREQIAETLKKLEATPWYTPEVYFILVQLLLDINPALRDQLVDEDGKPLDPNRRVRICGACGLHCKGHQLKET